MRSSVLARLIGALVAVIVVSSPTGEIAAHTDLDFTLPTQDATVGEPVDEITVGFTEPVTLVGAGFEVLDPQGNVVTPLVVTDDDAVFLLQLDPPLAGGEAAVRFEVRAEDGHVISGGFAFTVAAEAPAVATTTTTTTTTITTATTATTATTTTSRPPVAASSTAVAATTGSTSTDDAASDLTTTVPPETEASADVPVTSADASAADTDDDSSGSTAVVIALAVAVVIGAAVFLVIRSRA